VIRRVAILVVLVLVVLGLAQLDDPHTAPVPPRSPAVGPVLEDAADGSVWYCAAGGGDLRHEVIITSFGDDATARVTGFGATTGSAASIDVTVGAHSQHVVPVTDVGPGIGGVTVEVSGGPATVAHRVYGDTVDDQSTCQQRASDHWYFASADTERVGDVESTARVWLLNPFPTDASVDIRATYENIVRIPPKLRGLIVPAGGSRMVELNEAVPRSPQFAFSVEARGGRVVAELAQTVVGRGLRLQPGVPTLASAWYLADAFGGTNTVEQLHVYNPSATDTTASVSVLPNGVDPSAFPEPFLYEIPARRYVTVDLTVETRLPPEGLRSIRVDTADGPGVVVDQVDALAGGGGDGTVGTRPSVAGGLASSSGSSAQSTSWFLPSLGPASDGQPVVAVANPSPDAISVVSLASVVGGKRTVIADRLEVPPQQSLVVDVGEATAAGAIGVEVTSSTPVVVSGRSTSTERVELTMFPAVPDASKVSRLPDGG